MEEQNTKLNANMGAKKEPIGVSKRVKFDEFLKDRKNQAEFDRRVQKAIQTAQKSWKTECDKEKSKVEKLKEQLQKQQKENEEIQRELKTRQLKDEAIKIALHPETMFDLEFLDLFNFEDMTREQLQQKTKLLKTIQDKIVEKSIKEWSKKHHVIQI